MKLGTYTHAPFEGDVMTVEAFRAAVRSGGFIDYDGSGHPMKGGWIDVSCTIYPSTCERDLPTDATHVEWYNK